MEVEVSCNHFTVDTAGQYFKTESHFASQTAVGRLWTKPYCSRGMFDHYSDYNNIVKEAALNDAVIHFSIKSE